MGKPRTQQRSAQRAATKRATKPRQRRVRIAVYLDGKEDPRTDDVAVSARGGPQAAADRVVALVKECGGRVPEAAICEVVANLAHAGYEGAAVTILDGGDRVRVSDCGPGVGDVERALLPGYSSAGESLRSQIRGVGAGLPLAKTAMEAVGGRLAIDSNIGGGTVITLDARAAPAEPEAPPEEAQELPDRQKRVLALLREVGEAGPTSVAQELGAGLGTAHRALTALEQLGLVIADERGKRRLTEEGLHQLGVIFRG
ncbi:MAG: ATP-binding protein [Armatimonadota bacterium]